MDSESHDFSKKISRSFSENSNLSKDEIIRHFDKEKIQAKRSLTCTFEKKYGETTENSSSLEIDKRFDNNDDVSIETISDAKSELQPLRNHDGDGDAEKEFLRAHNKLLEEKITILRNDLRQKEIECIKLALHNSRLRFESQEQDFKMKTTLYKAQEHMKMFNSSNEEEAEVLRSLLDKKWDNETLINNFFKAFNFNT